MLVLKTMRTLLASLCSGSSNARARSKHATQEDFTEEFGEKVRRERFVNIQDPVALDDFLKRVSIEKCVASGIGEDLVNFAAHVIERANVATFPYALLSVLPALTDAKTTNVVSDEMNTLQQRCESILANPNCPQENYQAALLSLLFVETCTTSVGDAANSLFRRFAADKTLRWVLIDTTFIVLAMLKGGWYPRLAPSSRVIVRELLFNLNAETEIIWAAALTCIDLLGFSRFSPVSCNKAIFHEVILPYCSMLAERKQPDIALNLEALVYDRYVKQIESCDHFKEVMGAMVPVMARAGQVLRLPVPQSITAEPHSVGFLLHSDRVGAHTEVMLRLFEGLKQMDGRRIIPVVFLLGGATQQLQQSLERLNVRSIHLGPPDLQANRATSRSIKTRLMTLKEKAAEESITALIFVSTPVYMAFAFSMRVAPVQIWWSLKYQGIAVEETDGYLMVGSFERRRMIGGVHWHVHDAGVPNVRSGPEAIDQAQILRTRFKDFDLVATCIGREEKMHNREYLAAIVEILKRSVRTAFLWTGRYELPDAVAMFKASGVAERCFYLGWVADTKPYAHLTDLYLDTFPFGSGHTAFEAMYAGKPVLMYLSPETLASGVLKHVWPAYSGNNVQANDHAAVRQIFTGKDGEPLLFAAKTSEEYTQFAARLLSDAELRRRAGMAGKRFVEAYMLDPRTMAQSFSAHVLEIINATLVR